MKYLSLDGVTKLINKIKSSFVSNAGGYIHVTSSINSLGFGLRDNRNGGYDYDSVSLMNINGRISILSLGSKYLDDNNNGCYGVLRILNSKGKTAFTVNGSNSNIGILNPSDNTIYTLDIDRCIELGILTK